MRRNPFSKFFSFRVNSRHFPKITEHQRREIEAMHSPPALHQPNELIANMKLSVSYNFFNAEEHLIASIEQMRPMVDHISVVYQSISNHGYSMSPEAHSVIYEIKSRNLVDDLIHYNPDMSKHPGFNEFTKREIGLTCARKNNATHLLLMDADEFYEAGQFEKAKQEILKNNISYSACPSYLYIRKPIWRSEVPDMTRVCFIGKIDQALLFSRGQYFPCSSVDPTRRLVNTSGNFRLFEAPELVMHHMSLVRHDLSSKFQNSTNAEMTDFIKRVNETVSTWKFGDVLKLPGKPDFQIVEVENTFGLPSR